jgi:hypothetical protein
MIPSPAHFFLNFINRENNVFAFDFDKVLTYNRVFVNSDYRDASDRMGWYLTLWES